MLEKLLEELKSKQILILGFGREGRDSFRFLRKIFPNKVLGIADKNKNVKCQMPAPYRTKSSGAGSNVKNVRWHLAGNYLKMLKNYDVIIKSPGIPIHLPEIEKAYKEGKITSQTEIFFKNCPGKIVGITGTKGKGTTSSLIYQILSYRNFNKLKFRQPFTLRSKELDQIGKESDTTQLFRRKGCPKEDSARAKRVSIWKKENSRVHLIGNIGKPVLQLLLSSTPKDIYVYELSSHQLYNLKKSPQIAVFLNIYPDHLDYYKNFKEYANAKTNITKYQTKKDYLIYNYQDKIVSKIAKKSKAIKIPIPTNYEFITNIRIRKGIPFQNIMAAISIGKIFGISEKNIKKAIRQFQSLPHRLEYVGKFQGIEFYNDSASTMPQATIAALDALGNKVETLILGGSDKNLSFKNLAKFVLRGKIKNIILFPATGKKIWQEIIQKFRNSHGPIRIPERTEAHNALYVRGARSGYLHAFFVNSMKEAIKLAYKYTSKGKICLLSPASASFSLFRDYKERGDLFKKLVKKYAP